MTLRNLIDNGLLHNVSMICAGDSEIGTYFNIINNFLNVYVDDESFCFPLDNEVVFDGLFIIVKDKRKKKHYLSFLNCTTIDPESFKNK